MFGPLKWLLIAGLTGICFVANAQRSAWSPAYFTRADSIALSLSDHPIDVPLLARKLTGELKTEQEKFRAIFRWVCDNIAYDERFYEVNRRKRASLDEAAFIAWNKSVYPGVIRRLLNQRITVCTGYAYLIRELSLYAGLSCAIVDGYGRTSQSNVGGKGIPNHSWNAVKLNEVWYLCDATWASGAINRQQGTFEKDFNDVYFLTAPEFFIRNHYPLDTAWSLLTKTPAKEAFLHQPLMYTHAIRNNITALDAAFHISATKGENVVWRFNVPAELSGKLMIRVNSRAYTGAVTSTGMNNTYAFSHTFNQRGTYVVHALVDDRYAYSFNVNVE